MNKINIEILDKYLAKPIYIQSALDVKWDKAWKIPLTNTKPTEQDIDNFLSQGGTKLAFELFYETNYEGKFLCGSYFESNSVIPTKEKFLKGIFNIVFDMDISKISNAINYMNESLGNTDKLFSSKCTDVELGILDFWRFYPAAELLEVNDSNMHINLADKLKEFPYLQINKDNTALLEFVCDYTPLHFVGFTVSNKIDGEFVLDQGLINKITKDLLETHI